jgi:hypothetical protein
MFRLLFSGQLLKYDGEQSKWHPGELTWPGYKGVPVVGGVSYSDDVAYVTLVNYFQAKTFDLTNEADKDHYCWVMDRVYNGWFLKIRDELIKEDGKIKIYLEWVQRYLKQVPMSEVIKAELSEQSNALQASNFWYSS